MNSNFYKSTKLQATTLSILLFLCLLALFIVPPLWQFITTFLTFLILGSFVVHRTHNFHRHYNCDRQESKNEYKDRIPKLYVLSLVTATTGISAVLLFFVYLLSTSDDINQSYPTVPSISTTIILGKVDQYQKHTARKDDINVFSEFQATSSPTAYVILARPTPSIQIMPTYTPIPAAISDNMKALEFYSLTPRLIIAHVYKSNESEVRLNPHVVIINNGIEVNLDNWLLVTGTNQTCRFQNAIIKQGAIVRAIATNEIVDNKYVLCHSSDGFWKSNLNVLQLRDTNGNTIDQWQDFRSEIMTPVGLQ